MDESAIDGKSWGIPRPSSPWQAEHWSRWARAFTPKG